MASTGAVARDIAFELTARPSVDQAGIDALMREFFQKKPGEGGMNGDASVNAATAQPTPPRRDFDTATELLDRAAQAFDLLINRCQILEHDVDDANERASAQVAERDETIEQWKRLASGLKTQVEQAEQAVTTLKVRCEAAEARVATAEQKVAALERASAQVAGHAAIAEQLSTKLHDKVVSAFGIGSRAHPVLEAIATKSAAE